MVRRRLSGIGDDKAFHNKGRWAAEHGDTPFAASSGKAEANSMNTVKQVLLISPEAEHHEKLNAAMHRCGTQIFSRR